MAEYWELSGDEEEPRTTGLGKREKRLARNRESARKCRKKRKAFVNEMAEKVQTLTEDNAILELENRRLKELVRQLQSGAATSVPDTSSHKRAKCEQGALVANDFSESAVHASPSQQPETFYYPLAAWTTLLLLQMLNFATMELACSPAKQPAMILPETPAYVPAMLKTCRSCNSSVPPQHEVWWARSRLSPALTAVT